MCVKAVFHSEVFFRFKNFPLRFCLSIQQTFCIAFSQAPKYEELEQCLSLGLIQSLKLGFSLEKHLFTHQVKKRFEP